MSPRSTKFWRLVMRTSTSKSRWMSARPRNWSVVMSPRRQYAYALTVPLARPRTTLAVSHCCSGVRPANCTGVAPDPMSPPSAVTVGAHAGGGVALLARRSRGRRPGTWPSAMRNLRSLKMRSRSSSTPMVSTSHFRRARSLLSRLPWWSCTRRIASMVGEQVLARGELLERLRGVRVGAEPAGHEHPEAGLDGAVGERAVHRDHADVVEHRLAAVGGAAREVDLELPRQALRDRVAQEERPWWPRPTG